MDKIFYDCYSLTKVEIMATTLVQSCCASMFENCTDLKEIKVHFNDWKETYRATDSWLNCASAEGTFICPAGLVKADTPRDDNHVLPKWIVKSEYKINKDAKTGVKNIKLMIGKNEVQKACNGDKVKVVPTFVNGYELRKITVTDNSGKSINVDKNGVSTMPKSDVTVSVTARTEAPVVRFVSDGATYITIDVKYGGKVAKPTDPVKKGSVFKGWYTKSTGGTLFDFNTPIKDNTTLYTRWVKLKQVTNLSAKALDAAKAQITWESNGNKNVYYKLYVSTKPDKGFKKLATIKNGKTTYTQDFTPTQSGKKYYFAVRAAIKDYKGKWHYGKFSNVDYAYPI